MPSPVPAARDRLQRAIDAWSAWEPWTSIAAFLGGFAWDALTLVRVDRLLDNLLLALYLVALGVLLVIEHRVSRAPEAWPRLAPRAAAVTWGVQFLLGGLFSAQVVYYVRAAWWGPQVGFLVVLVLGMLLNEFLHERLRSPWVRTSLYWFLSYTLLRFLVVVATGWVHSGLLVVAAAGATAATLAVAWSMTVDREPAALRRVLLRQGAMSVVLASTLGAMEAASLVPPVPLTVRHLGVAHCVTPPGRVDACTGEKVDDYTVTRDASSWRAWAGATDPTFRRRPGDRVNVYSEVFVPVGVTIEVFHHWQRWDARAEAWRTLERLDVTRTKQVSGVDEDTLTSARGTPTAGFRTWSTKANVPAGPIRVLVELDDGRELARLGFLVVDAPEADPRWRPWRWR